MNIPRCPWCGSTEAVPRRYHDDGVEHQCSGCGWRFTLKEWHPHEMFIDFPGDAPTPPPIVSQVPLPPGVTLEVPPCPFCDHDEARPTRCHDEGIEHQCQNPDCARRFTVKEDHPGVAFGFFPGDIHALVRADIGPAVSWDPIPDCEDPPTPGKEDEPTPPEETDDLPHG